jgi:dTDP-4-dehydrorhamnose 3,5-epimerase
VKVTELRLPGVLLFEPRRFEDHRGWFAESWNARRYRDAGLDASFVQDNTAFSRRGVLRGLHFQDPHPQGKLVWALAGEVWDVAVDVRPGSPTFGEWLSCTLSAENARQIFIPEGFAHGFLVLSDSALCCYKCTDLYRPEAEGTLLWNDPDLAIPWPIADPILSEKDREGLTLDSLQTRRV